MEACGKEVSDKEAVGRVRQRRFDGTTVEDKF
jgi:hypothetical protein